MNQITIILFFGISLLLAGCNKSDVKNLDFKSATRATVTSNSVTTHLEMEKKFAIPRENIKQLVPPMGGCFITDRVTVDGLKVGYMYREQPDKQEDSGWRFFSGDETQEYIDDLSHTGIYAVNTAANYDPDIIPFLETPPPCAFEKDSVSGKFKKVEN